MKWDETSRLQCSVARTLSVVGERWTLLIVRDAFMGVRRFEDFQRDLGITRHLLSERLRKLVAHGIFARVAYQQKPERYEYRLSEKGLDLYPILISLLGWGDRWMSDEHGPPLRLENRACGHEGAPVLCCSECGEPVSPADMRARPAPALSREADKAGIKQRPEQ